MDPFQATVHQVAEYLVYLFDHTDTGYSVVNTHRCAISALLPPIQGATVGKHPLVKKVMKGIFRLRPSLPRYTVTYDVQVVLDYLDNLGENSVLTLKQLTERVATLLCLLSGQRDQTFTHRCQGDKIHFRNGLYPHLRHDQSY